MKLKLLLNHFKEDEPFGKLAAFLPVIDFQKRGLVHAQIISFLDDVTLFSQQDPSKIDNLISVEIPLITSPHLREFVVKHMIHAPCSNHPDSRCMREGQYSKTLPKPFRSVTASIEGVNYVSYRRLSPEEGGESEVRTKKSNVSGICKVAIDNSKVVPYSLDLLRKFCTQMNVELCISRVGSIKYLFKYVCKGSERVKVEIEGAPTDGKNESISKGVITIDGIRHYQDARYVSASEAPWRLISFPIVEHESSVEQLEIHLKSDRTVYYKEGEHENAKTLGKEKSTRLTAYFAANQKFKNAKASSRLTFRSTSLVTNQKGYGNQEQNAKSEVSHLKTMTFQLAVQVWSAGRTISAHEKGNVIFVEKCFYTQIWATSFPNMRLHEGVPHPTYRDICWAIGLLLDDAE